MLYSFAKKKQRRNCTKSAREVARSISFSTKTNRSTPTEIGHLLSAQTIEDLSGHLHCSTKPPCVNDPFFDQHRCAFVQQRKPPAVWPWHFEDLHHVSASTASTGVPCAASCMTTPSHESSMTRPSRRVVHCHVEAVVATRRTHLPSAPSATDTAPLRADV